MKTPKPPSLDSTKELGSIHPITNINNILVNFLTAQGYEFVDGPEIETEEFNFDMLNIHKLHPARQMHDTFYVENKSHLLRTHTSPVQIRGMLNRKPPIAFISNGKVYRKDDDATHLPMFHQLEGICVDKNISFSNLKDQVYKIITFIFGSDTKVRFRPSYFPFTEPSAEVDINCKISSKGIKLGDGDQWLEILGCGMVHPNVFEKVGIEKKELTGFAFGVGIERLAMLKYGMPDLRDFYDGDLRWLNHYGFSFFDNSDLSWK